MRNGCIRACLRRSSWPARTAVTQNRIRRSRYRRVSYGFETYNPICQRKAGSFLSVNIWTTMALGQNVSDGVANPVRQEGQNVSDGVANPVRQETPSGRKPRPAGNPVRQETPSGRQICQRKAGSFLSVNIWEI